MTLPTALHRVTRAAVVTTTAVMLGVLGAGCGVLPGTGSSSARTPPPGTASGPATAPASPPSDGASSPTTGGSAAPTPGSATPAGPVLASRTFTVRGTYNPGRLTMRLDVVALQRRGDLLDLQATLTNTAQDGSVDQRWQVASRFSGAYRKDLNVTDGAFAGAVLTDTAGKKRYLVAADSAGACVCTVGLSSTFVDAGQTVLLDATYAAPPATTTTLDVSVPTLGTFRDLPVS